ncbi:MAG: HDOD domain-containing protein [Myxococcota bacterium]|nr:HDOD domain-containing protein [Myxococcota bacterium]
MVDTNLNYSCPECGTPNPGAARFCNGCGTRLACEVLPPKPDDPLIGTLIDGRFRVHERLGAGGMGIVYRAEQVSVGRLVALKLLTPRTGTDPRLSDRFRNEAMLSSRLNHPNTVIIYDFGVTDVGALYLAMELIAGKSLDEELNRVGVMDFERTRHIALQVCDSLHDAHLSTIVHRDLKPDNVMLTRIGTRGDVVKVLDFGIAKILDPNASERTSHLTAPNEVFGTPEYMAPEQISANPVDNRTDIYALGVMLFRMLTGTLPYTGDSPVAILAKHLGEPIPLLSAAAHGIELPDGLSELVASMLAKNPNDRPKNMLEVAAQLKSLGRVVYSRNAPPPTPSPLPKQSASAPQAVPAPSGPNTRMPVLPEPAPVAGPAFPVEAAPEEPRVTGLSLELGLEGEVDEPEEDTPSQVPDSEPALQKAKLPPMPTAAYEPQAGESRKETTLRVLVERMKKRPDFPVISQHLTELNTKAGMSSTSAADLANVILKDLSLTTKLLRLVNSPYYGQVRGRVNAVSRAVVLIGFDTVRQSVLGLTLFDHLRTSNPEMASDLQDGALQSLATGILGKIVASRDSNVNNEDVFIAGLLKDMGRQIALFYFSKEMKEIKKQAEELQRPEATVFQAQMGVSFDELGVEVASQWGFPEKLRTAMVNLPPGPLPKIRNATDRAQVYSTLGRELSEAAALAGPQRQRALGEIQERFKGVIQLTDKDIEAFLDEGLDVLEDYSKLLDLPVRGSLYLRNLLTGSGRERAAGEKNKPRSAIAAIQEALDAPPSPMTSASEEDITDRQQILSAGALDVAEQVKRGKFELNELMLAVLEAMYRGLGLHRVSFMFHDVRSKTMRARSGFGPDIEKLLADFAFKIDGRMDLFNKSLATGADISVADTRDPKQSPYVPPWYKKLIDAPMFLLLPVRIKGFPAALFYGDFNAPHQPLDPRLMAELGTGVCRSDEDCSSRHTTEDRMTMFEFPQERKVYATAF